jgi:hypothetical protein
LRCINAVVIVEYRHGGQDKRVASGNADDKASTIAQAPAAVAK